MAFTPGLAVGELQIIPGYVGEFKVAFGSDKITIDKITQALAVFEETLVTPNARFDLWLKGDDHAITAQEKRGYALFRDPGCVACHNSQAVGSSSFQKWEFWNLIKPLISLKGA